MHLFFFPHMEQKMTSYLFLPYDPSPRLTKRVTILFFVNYYQVKWKKSFMGKKAIGFLSVEVTVA